MKCKQDFLAYIDQAAEIVRTAEVQDNNLSGIRNDIEQIELIVPVVGGFSAGKSTLINSFLGTEILPTAITPETALATELCYSRESYIEAVSADGKVERYSIQDFASIKDNAKNFQFLRLYLDNEKLAAIQPLVLVDMPGFDAPIANHNQAILRYLNRGVYFVFLTSIEDGNITARMKREIENLQQFGKGFAFCISKTNLRAADDVALVRDQIREQLQDYFDYHEQIVLLDDNGGENLKNILQAIDAEKLFDSIFCERLQDNYHGLVQSINLKASTLKSSCQEAEEAINGLKNGISSLEARQATALEEVKERYSVQEIRRITERVVQDVQSHKGRLIEMAMHNPQSMSHELNDLVQNSLLREVNNSLRTIGNQLVQDFGSHLKLNLLHDQHNLFDAGFVERLQNQTQKVLGLVASGLSSWSESLSRRGPIQGGGNLGIYRGLSTVLGLVTRTVAPVVGMLVTFLPDIINFFMKGQREKQQRAQIEQAIANDVIPQIRQQLQNSLSEIMQQQLAVMVQDISRHFEEELAKKREEIAQAVAEKEASSAQLEEILGRLEQSRHELDKAAQQYLFV